MKLEHSFSVPVGVDDAWRILVDIERVAPCMPGAALESLAGEEFTGNVKVKLGAINLTYKGKASFIEKDPAAHRAVIDARGRDARGNGTATAHVTTWLTEEDGATTVRVNTDLDVTGKVAQFGRGVMADVGNKLIGQFADCLVQQIESGNAAGAPSAAASDASPRASEEAPAAENAAGRGDAPAAAAAAASAAAAVGASGASPEPTPTDPAVDDAALKAISEEAAYAAPVADGTASANGHGAGSADLDVEPLNLLQHAGPAIMKRAAPPLVALLLVLLIIVLRRRRT